MAHLYADENVPMQVVGRLRELGHDVLAVVEDGKGNRRYPDAFVLRDAAASGRAVVTLNRAHFRRLHHESAGHAGIVLCTCDPDFAGQAFRIHQQLEALDSVADRLLQVYPPPK